MRPAESLREHARGCAALGSPMYADLLARLAADHEAGGPTAEVLAGYADAPGPSALALRLVGRVHALVLERRAGSVAAYFPSVGGTWEPEGGTKAVLELFASEPELVREWLDRPPQTNEVGRAAALYGGLLHLPAELRLPVRLREIGASGGLNLLADRFCHRGEDGSVRGERHSPVVLDPAWDTGPEPWPSLEVVDRVGCDLLPVDVTSTEGRLALTAYVWPDQVARHERLRGALRLAAETPPVVGRQGAADFLEELAPVAGTTTVVWHSVMWQYLPAEERARASAALAALGELATREAPVVHLSFEPTRRAPGAPHEFLVVLETWPGGTRRVLGAGPAHGLPVRWEP